MVELAAAIIVFLFFGAVMSQFKAQIEILAIYVLLPTILIPLGLFAIFLLFEVGQHFPVLVFLGKAFSYLVLTAVGLGLVFSPVIMVWLNMRAKDKARSAPSTPE